MKSYILLLLICINFLKANGQINKEIVGKWKVISVTTSEFYIDLKTDSCSIYEKLKSHYPYIDDQKKIILEAKKLYSWQVQFSRDGIFNQYSKNNSVHEGKYDIDTGLSILTIHDKDASENDKGEKIKIYFKDGKLYQLFENDGDSQILVLERQ